jgi:type I restriction enzyme M protein
LVELEFQQKTKILIDSLKNICANYGLGNDGNEFKIITQTFLYKFLNDKFAFEAKKIDETIAKADKWEEALAALSEDDLEMLQLQIGPDAARLKPSHFINYLFSQQNAPDFAKLFDDTLMDIAISNNDVFAVKTDGGAKVVLFDRLSNYIADESKRDNFCRALINKLVEFSFERIFDQKFDFYATIFEYLIKDYNSNSGGKYAEYYTPHAVARIMAAILVPEEQQGKIKNVSCYDPSAGSGTLLMNVAHAIGENRCSIYTQDISQKSSNLLRLNLILNNLVHSIPNVIQGNTLLHPYHKDGSELKRFDFIVSNPPFKMDFSDYRRSRPKPRTRWKSTSCSCSTLSTRSNPAAKRRSLYPLVLLPHKPVSIKRFASIWSSTRCWPAWCRCRAIFSPLPAPTFPSCLSTPAIKTRSR